jgi:hypothetical protein
MAVLILQTRHHGILAGRLDESGGGSDRANVPFEGQRGDDRSHAQPPGAPERLILSPPAKQAGGSALRNLTYALQRSSPIPVHDRVRHRKDSREQDGKQDQFHRIPPWFLSAGPRPTFPEKRTALISPFMRQPCHYGAKRRIFLWVLFCLYNANPLGDSKTIDGEWLDIAYISRQ